MGSILLVKLLSSCSRRDSEYSIQLVPSVLAVAEYGNIFYMLLKVEI